MRKLLKGTYTAIITPFTEENKVDWNALERIVEMQIEGNVDGVLFVGTTGESPTLTYNEHKEILHRSMKMVNGRCKVLHGTGSNNTTETIEYAKTAQDAGADAQLVINPYYNKPTQEGLYSHFMSVADASTVPVIMYNIKSRTGVNLETETLLRLVKHQNIAAVKEASGDISQMMDVINETPDDFSVLVGDDALTLPFMACGGDGVISVVSNVMPKTMSEYIQKCLAGKFEEARPVFYRMLDVIKAAFIESNPTPVKEMLSILGYSKPGVRLPLTRVSEKSMAKVKTAVEIIKELER